MADDTTETVPDPAVTAVPDTLPAPPESGPVPGLAADALPGQPASNEAPTPDPQPSTPSDALPEQASTDSGVSSAPDSSVETTATTAEHVAERAGAPATVARVGGRPLYEYVGDGVPDPTYRVPVTAPDGRQLYWFTLDLPDGEAMGAGPDWDLVTG